MRQHAADATCNCYPLCEPKDGFLSFIIGFLALNAAFGAIYVLVAMAAANNPSGF